MSLLNKTLLIILALAIIGSIVFAVLLAKKNEKPTPVFKVLLAICM